MIDFLLRSEEDITLLTCKECAIDIWVELLEAGYEFVQDRASIIREINKNDGIYEITKLVSESSKEDMFFVFASDDRVHLEDRLVVVDDCIMELIENEVDFLDEDEHCDECLVVEEIMMDDSLSYEEALRTAYRCGRETALFEVAEDVEFKMFQ